MKAFVKTKMKEMGFPGFLAGLFTKGYLSSNVGQIDAVKYVFINSKNQKA